MIEMMRIKLYLGSQELEKYLNKKVQHNYILETIIPFGLFQPLRLDVLKFKKKKDLQRIYIVDSNDLVLIKRKYQIWDGSILKIITLMMNLIMMQSSIMIVLMKKN